MPRAKKAWKLAALAFYLFPKSMLELDSSTPQRLPLEGRSAHGEAIDTLLPFAERRIGIFDQDLVDTAWNSVRRAQLLERFLRRSQSARIDVYLRDARRIDSTLPRLAAMLRLWQHAFAIYQVGDDALGVHDSFMVVDRRHYWHRFHFEQARGELGIAQPEAAGALSKRLFEIHEISGPPVPVTVLGL